MLKKIKFFVVIIGAFASCSLETEMDPISKQDCVAVSFGAEIQKTKSLPVTTTNFTVSHESFGVVGYTYSAESPTEKTRHSSGCMQVNYNSTEDRWEPAMGIPYSFDGNKLQFYAWYPYDNTLVPTSAPATINESVHPTITYTVPESVADQKDLLVAKVTNISDSPSEDTPIQLTFNHVLSAIKFKIAHGFSVSSISFIGIPMTATLDMDALTWGDASNPQDFDLGANPSFTSGSTYDTIADEFTVMAIPQILPIGAQVVAVTELGTFTMSLAGHVWEQGKVMTYMLSDTINWDIPEAVDIITPSNSKINLTRQTFEKTFTLTRYRRGMSLGTVNWEAYYSGTTEPVLNETTISEVSSTFPDWFSMSVTSGDGDANPVTITIEPGTIVMESDHWYEYAPSGYNSDAVAERNALMESPASDRDLSTWDFVSKTTGSCETANCYIIQNYGTYLLPCVYGNAYNNSGSYTNSTTGNNPLNGFINAKGNAITNPVIPTDISGHGTLSARVVWQDTQEGSEMISDSDLEYIETPGTAAACPYIRINFQQEKIMPGNVVIALYDEDNEEILWSWHLWVTSHSFSTVDVKQGKTSSFLTNNTQPHLDVNLGWCPPVSYPGGTLAATDPVWVAIFDIELNRCVAKFKVQRSGYTLNAEINTLYTNTYYQWGRKDPFLPSRDGTKAKIFSSGSIYARTRDNVEIMNGSGGTTGLKEWILYPYKFVVEASESLYPQYCNLWNATDASASDAAVTKTVYDPCPRGFKVPNRYAYSGFSTAKGQAVNDSGKMPAGYLFTTDNSTDNSTWTFYVPRRGYRVSSGGGLNEVRNWGRYWTATRLFTDFAYYLLINQNTTVVETTYAPNGGNCVRPVQD